jgi:hypothetical protein
MLTLSSSGFDPTATSDVHRGKLIPASGAFTVDSSGRVGLFTGAAPGIGHKKGGTQIERRLLDSTCRDGRRRTVAASFLIQIVGLSINRRRASD